MELGSKNERILFIYVQLANGLAFNKKQVAIRFGVSEHSIQRDIERIRDFVEMELICGLGARGSG